MAERVHHNHVTRDVKAVGKCPACDLIRRPKQEVAEPLSAATLTALPPALAEELAKALNAAGWTCFEGSHEPGHYGSCADCQRVCNEQVTALVPILSRALTEAAEKMRDQTIVAVDAESLEDETGEPEDVAYQSAINDSIRAIRAIPNPYLTEKEN